MDGVPNAFWSVFPNMVLKSGERYYIDVNPDTGWSCNAESGNAGFVQIRAESVSLSPADTKDPNDYPVYFSNMNADAVQGNPLNYPDLITGDQDILVQAISTYHLSGGEGSEPGVICIYDWDDHLIGRWQATGREVKGGVSWDVFPNVVLKANTMYYIWDSSLSTWCQNDQNGNTGFVKVRATASPTKLK